jgi:hypothetical protein
MKIECKAGAFKAIVHKNFKDKIILMSKFSWVLPKLKQQFAEIGEVETNDEWEYPFHAMVGKQAFSAMMFEVAGDVDYSDHTVMMQENTPEEAMQDLDEDEDEEPAPEISDEDNGEGEDE